MVADAALRLVALFSVAGLGLTTVRHHPQARVFVTRFTVWAAIAAVWLAALAAGPTALRLLATAIGAVGAAEYARMTQLPRPDAIVLCSACAALPLATASGGSVWLAVLALAVLAGTIPPLLAEDVAAGWDRIARSTLGVLWLGAGATCVAVLSAPHVLALGVAVALADVGAFVAGSLVGGRRLAERLSPHKTWAGVAGGALGATLGLLLVVDLVGIIGAAAPAIGLAIALCATWGDLLESLVKRTAAVKDAGAWLPGFGGLLDRADSLLVTAPAWWAVTTLVG